MIVWYDGTSKSVHQMTTGPFVQVQLMGMSGRTGAWKTRAVCGLTVSGTVVCSDRFVPLPAGGNFVQIVSAIERYYCVLSQTGTAQCICFLSLDCRTASFDVLNNQTDRYRYLAAAPDIVCTL